MGSSVAQFPPAASEATLPRGPFVSGGIFVLSAQHPVAEVEITGRLTPDSKPRDFRELEASEYAFARRIAACLNFCDGASTADLERLRNASLTPPFLLGAAALAAPGTIGEEIAQRLAGTWTPKKPEGPCVFEEEAPE